MKIALGVEYDGTPFAGWEIQAGRDTVQGNVDAAVSKVANHPLRTVCAGRTDAGVHALGQVVHFETRAERELRAWVFGTNANLPREISVLWAIRVDDSFHARFSARCRHYRYIILNRSVRPAVGCRRVAWTHGTLDVRRMQAAADCLVGEHDFTSYRSVACQARNPVRTVYRLAVGREGEIVTLDISANAFLHHMVRNIAGVLMTVGSGRQDPDWAARVLAARDRTRGGVTAKPHGLYLAGVDYPEIYAIPARAPSGLIY